MANLASIHSKEEMHLIKLTLDSYTTPSWIGLVEVAGGGRLSGMLMELIANVWCLRKDVLS